MTSHMSPPISDKSGDVMSRDLRLVPYWSPPRVSINNYSKPYWCRNRLCIYLIKWSTRSVSISCCHIFVGFTYHHFIQVARVKTDVQLGFAILAHGFYQYVAADPWGELFLADFLYDTCCLHFFDFAIELFF